MENNHYQDLERILKQKNELIFKVHDLELEILKLRFENENLKFRIKLLEG